MIMDSTIYTIISARIVGRWSRIIGGQVTKSSGLYQHLFKLNIEGKAVSLWVGLSKIKDTICSCGMKHIVLDKTV